MTPFFTTTLAAAANAGDTNIKVASITAMVAGQTINIDTGAAVESRVIQSVGTAGATGTGVTLTAPLSLAHASGAPVTPAGQQINVDTGAASRDGDDPGRRHRRRDGHRPDAHRSARAAHASGAQVERRTINVEVDQSGGNQET